MNELTIAIRHLVRRPAFAILGIFALGAGLAAAILVFGIINTMLLRPLPGIADPDRLVEVGRVSRSGAFDSVSYPYFTDLQERTRTLDDLFAYRLTPAYVERGETPEYALTMLVSGNYFSTLGATPLHGQLFGPAHDAAPGLEPVAVLSEAGFRRRLDSDPSRIGEVLRINGSEYTVIGVTRDGFGGHVAAIVPEVFIPLSMAAAMRAQGDEARNQRGSSWLNLGGRLTEGATVEGARAELAVVSRTLAPLAQDPDQAPVFDATRLRPLPQAAHKLAGILAGGLMTLCMIVLALACSNLAGVLLARGEARMGELALCSALGASRGRIARQLFLEASLVAVLGGVAGLILAVLGRDVLQLISLPAPFPINLGIVIDLRVIAFTFGITALAAVAFGVVPALKISAAAPAKMLAGGGPGSTRTTPGGRQWLLAIQSALTVALLLVAMLTFQALDRAGSVDTGFRIDGVRTASFDTAPLGWEAEVVNIQVQALVDGLRREPGIEQVTYASVMPLTTSRLGYGDASLPGTEGVGVDLDINTVGDGFFGLFELPVRGRPIDRRDAADGPAVAVINESLAARLYGEQDPLGREFVLHERTLRVIGVVPDGRYSSLADEGRAFAFLPATQWPRTPVELFMRGPADSAAFVRALERGLADTLPAVPPPQVHRYADMAAISILPQRILGSAASLLGVLALILAATGIYGVLAFQVERRFREFGVRRALGASGPQVASALVRRVTIWILGGALAGVVLAQGIAAAMGGLLLGVTGTDPVALSVTGAVFGMMIVTAVYAPMMRALRLHPMEALRYE